MLLIDSPSDDLPSAKGPQVQEAYENLRMIREVMERSTKHSSLSGYSGILVGIWAILGVWITGFLALPSIGRMSTRQLAMFGLTWTIVLLLSLVTDFMVTKRRATVVGKQVFSQLGSHIVGAAAPGFTVGLVLSLFLMAHDQLHHIWAYWMLAYGLAICAVGMFSVRPVSALGWAFLICGSITLFLPSALGLWMMALAFGGFHILYGMYTGVTRRDW